MAGGENDSQGMGQNEGEKRQMGNSPWKPKTSSQTNVYFI
jgi:hypothetical protein